MTEGGPDWQVSSLRLADRGTICSGSIFALFGGVICTNTCSGYDDGDWKH